MQNWEWPEADRLEAKEHYRKAYTYMACELKRDPDNLKIHVRLSFLCWYILVEWGLLKETDLVEEDYNECSSLLKKLVEEGEQKYSDNPEFLWVFGYMLSLFPEILTGQDIDRMEKQGIEMMEKALELWPKDPIILLLLAEEREMPIAELQELKRKAAEILPERFRGSGEMQRYFREVLDRI